MGAASLSAVLALGDGAEAFARRRLEAEGLQTVLVAARTADRSTDGSRALGRAPRGRGRDVPFRCRRPVVGVVLTGRGVVRWKTPVGADRAAAVTGTLVLGSALSPAMTAGRVIGPDDAASEARVAVVSLSLARTLAPDDAARAVGQVLAVGDQRLRIVGVLAKPEGRDPPVLQVPFALLDRLPLSGPAEPPVITLRPARLEDVEALRIAADAWGTSRHGDGLTVQAYGPARLRQAAQGILIFKLLMGSFTAIALVVGGIGIMNVLLASVLERTREIGVRRAVGARRSDVVRQLLAESVAIALAGSLVGLALGLGSAFLFTAIMRRRPRR